MAIIVAIILIANIYTIPQNVQTSYGHSTFLHGTCWSTIMAAPILVLTIAKIVLNSSWVALAPVTFGATTAAIPPTTFSFSTAKLVAFPFLPLLTYACPPEMSPPPFALGGATSFECNDVASFRFNELTQVVDDADTFKDGTLIAVGKVIPTTVAPPNSEVFPAIVTTFFLFILLQLTAPILIGIGLSFFENLHFAFSLAASLAFAITLLATGQSWKQIMNREFPNEAIASHPTAILSASTSSSGLKDLPTDFKFQLGDNKVTYFAKTFLGMEDKADFRFNVYDSTPPVIDFGDDKHIILEANAHYGFKVTPKTEPIVFNNTKVTDNCAPNIIPEYVGPPFFLLSSLKQDQYATWTATDNGYMIHQPNIFDLTKVQTEFRDLKTNDAFIGPFVAAFDPDNTVEFYTAPDNQATLKYFMNVENKKRITELVTNTTGTQELVVADVILAEDVFDPKTKKIITVSKDGNVLTSQNLRNETTMSPQEMQASRPGDNLNAFFDAITGQQQSVTFFGMIVAAFGGDVLAGLEKPTVPANVMMDFQFVMVEDNIPPDMLVLENPGIEVNATHPGETANLKSGESCSGVGLNTTCDLILLPPVIFDIADPFPKIFQNITNPGNLTEIEGDLRENFPLGVTFINWTATDFTGNTNSITSFVNIKLNGTNVAPSVFNVTTTADATVPKEIKVSANNTDRDPLQFILEANPSRGIIDSPIDAVFQNKFQIIGAVSKLTGITHNPFTGPDEVFFTDSLNSRVLKQTFAGDLSRNFTIPQIPQPDRPEAISDTGTTNLPNEYFVSDWFNEKIFNIKNDNGNSTLIEELDVSGLFEDPEYLSVKNSKIFVTDTANGTITRIDNINTFTSPINLDSPSGVAVNGTQIFVSDTGNNRIIGFANSTFGLEFGTEGSDPGEFMNPAGIAVNSSRIFVVDSGNHRIQIFDGDGNVIDQIGDGSIGIGNLQFSSPTDIAINASEIFVSDTGNSRIQIFDSLGNYLRSIVNNLTDPTGITVNGTQIFVTDTSNHMVKEFNSTGALVSTLGITRTNGMPLGEFTFPEGIANNGTHIFVADTGNDRIQIFNSTGDAVFFFKGSGMNKLDEPKSVDIDENNDIVIADTGKNRIQKFDTSGNFLETLESKRTTVNADTTLFELSPPNIQAKGFDFENDKVFIGDWTPGREQTIVGHYRGGDLEITDISEFVNKPENLAFVDSENVIFVTDSEDKTLVKLDNNPKIFNLTGISGLNITPTGITVASGVVGYPDDQIFVFDNSTEKIIAFTEDNPVNTAVVAFDATNLFSSLLDITINGTHVFGLDKNGEKTSVVQIPWDKGVVGRSNIDSAGNVAGISPGKGIDSDKLFYINSTVPSIFAINKTSQQQTQIVNMSGIVNEPSAIAVSPMISSLKKIFVSNTANTEGIEGIEFSPNFEKIYVANFPENNLKVFNSSSGEIIGSIEGIVNQTNFVAPFDMEFSANGTLFVTSSDPNNSNIIEVNVTDNTLTTFATGVGTGITGATGIAFTNDDKFLLVSSNIEHTVVKLAATNTTQSASTSYIDLDGQNQTASITDLLHARGEVIGDFFDAQNSQGLVNPYGIDIDSLGNVYVSSFNTDQVLFWDADGNPLGVFAGDDQSGLDGPTHLTFSPDGERLLVSSSRSNQVLEYNGTSGAFIGVASDEAVSLPKGLAIDENDDLFVGSLRTNEILQYGPVDIKFVISDWTTAGNHTLFGFNENGTLIEQDNIKTKANLIDPKNIATSFDGKIWISDKGNQTLVKYDFIQGETLDIIDLSNLLIFEEPPLTPFTVPGTNITRYLDSKGDIRDSNATITITASIKPEGISIDVMENFFVSDWENNRIVSLDKDGEFRGTIKVNSTFYEPGDISVNQDNSTIPIVHVFDAMSNDTSIGEIISIDPEKQLQVFDFSEELSPIMRGLGSNGSSVFTVASDSGSFLELDSMEDISFSSAHFIEPRGIDVEGNSIYVSDWKEKRIVELDSDDGGFIAEFNTTAAGFFIPDDLRDIEFDPNSDRLIIADPVSASITQVDLEGSAQSIEGVSDVFVANAGLAVDEDDNFFISSSEDQTIIKFDQRGNLLAKSAPIILGSTGIMKDLAYGLDPNTNQNSAFLLVTNPIGYSILKFNSTSLEEQTSVSFPNFISDGDADILFTSTAITLDEFGNIFVSGTDVFSAISTGGIILKLDSTFCCPTIGNTISIQSASFPVIISDIEIDSKNNLIASDKGLHRIHKYDLTLDSYIGWMGKCDSGSLDSCNFNDKSSKGFQCDGTVSDCSNSGGKNFGRNFGQFFKPAGLALDRLDNIFVSDWKLSRDNALFEDDPMINEQDVFNRGNSPRIQKFSNNGFFVEQTLSDLNNTSIKENFMKPTGMAHGTNFFYLTDVDKLVVFDVNPFDDIKLNATTNVTSAKITYESISIEFFPGKLELDSFQYTVHDGFDPSNNTGFVNILLLDPDIDGDGIYNEVDPTNSTFFKDPITNTTGFIVDRGDQILTIRDDRDPEKGIFIQSDISESGEESATISACNNATNFDLLPGNRITVTCTASVELDVIRGNIHTEFLDEHGRISSGTVFIDNSIFFSPDQFEFITENNLDILNQTLMFNNEPEEYLISPTSTIRADTTPPILPELCSDPIMLEAESLLGIEWTADPSNPMEQDPALTKSSNFEMIVEFLDVEAIDVDNGDPQRTHGDIIKATHNATSIFPLIANQSAPTETPIKFTAIDEAGNIAECISIVSVRDRTIPKLEIVDLPVNKTINAPAHSDAGRLFYIVPKIFDLPEFFMGDDLEVTEMETTCLPPSGSEFPLSEFITIRNDTNEELYVDNFVNCFGKDRTGINKASASFTVRVLPPTDVSETVHIQNVTASSKNTDSDISSGDTLSITFSMPTNKPKVSNIDEINELLNITNPNSIGDNAQGQWIDSSNLLIKIRDIPSPTLVPGVTTFDINSNSSLQSESGVINSTSFSGIPNPVILQGSFSQKAAPYITAFLADDPSPIEIGILHDEFYSDGDTFTIRFSEPTNAPLGFGIHDMSKVDEIFAFSPGISAGHTYTGQWINSLTYKITVDKMNGPTSMDAVLGTTQVTVKETADLKDSQGKSSNSVSISPPLSGSFAMFEKQRVIKPNGIIASVLPSGISFDVKFPEGNPRALLQEGKITNLEELNLLSIPIDVTPGNETLCEVGCTVSFTFHKKDLDSKGISISGLTIFHDKNDNNVFDRDESIRPIITNLADSQQVSASAIVSSLSIFAISSVGGGGGGDESPPSFESASISGGSGGGPDGLIIEDLKFENDLQTIIVETGEPLTLKLTLYENSGVSALEHISLYTNLRGFERQVHQSDAYIRYDKGSPVSAHDPNGLFSDFDITINEVGGKLEIVFTLIFEKSMDTSDIIIRAWDVYRNSADTRLSEAIKVVDSTKILEIPEEIDELGLSGTFGNQTGEIFVDQEILEVWAGFASGSISDKELLELLGIEGDYIPEWYKKQVGKWIAQGYISQQEFVDALEFFYKQGFLT